MKAKRAYSDLLTLWKSADPEIPVLEEARAESARLPQAARSSGVRRLCRTTIQDSWIRSAVPSTAMLKSFDHPDDTRELTRGRFDIVRIGGVTIGRATYEPGWKWSEHVGRALGLTRCTVEHVGLVLEGAAVAVMDDGRLIELKAGTLFHVPGDPHDSWVIGDQRYVSLHFLGAEGYALGDKS